MSGIDEARHGVEEELRQVVLERVAAVRAKDPEPLAARQAPDVITFDVLAPLHSRGSDAVEQKTRAWFDSYAGEIGYEVRALHIAADGDVGFCSSCTTSAARWLPAVRSTCGYGPTLGCRRTDGQWFITHDHESVPFDPASGQALIDLNPGTRAVAGVR